MKRTLAWLLSAAIVLLAPGVSCYRAVAAELGERSAVAPSLPAAAPELPSLPSLPQLAPGLAPVDPAPAQALAGSARLASPEAAQAPEAVPAAAEAAKAQPELRALAGPEAGKKGVVGRIFDNVKRRVQASAVEAMGGGGIAGGGTLAPLTGGLLFQALSPAPPAPKPPLRERLKSALSLSEFEPGEKAYIAAESLFYLGLSVYVSSLPILVQALTGSAAMTGMARLVHYWTEAAALVFSGAIAERLPMQRILAVSAGTRGLIFGVIGVTAMAGLLPWHGFLALVAANALLISVQTLVGMGSDGAAKVFSSDKKMEKAAYLYSLISASLMLVVPPLLGKPMDLLSARYGAGFGAGAGYAAVALLMGASAWIYATKVRASRELVGRLSDLKDSLSSFWAAVSPASALKAIWRNRGIRARATMMAFESFIDDALFSVVLPTFAVDILLAGAFGNGLLMSAVTAGSLISSALLLKRADALQARLGVYRFLKILTAVACFAFVPSIALWAGAPGLLAAIPAVFLMKLMTSPLRSRMNVLLQTSVKGDAAAAPQSRRIFSVIAFFDVVAAGAGGWVFSSLFLGDHVRFLSRLMGANAPMKLVTAAMAATSLVYLAGLRWIRGQTLAPAREVFPSQQPESAALAKLETNLRRMGLPAPLFRKIDGPAPERPTVAILAPASVYKLSIAREGGRQSSGDVHLALDPSWLIRSLAPGQGARLLLTKGLYFDGDQAVVAEYQTPRPVHYFADFFTPGANERSDGLALERDLDVPMSSSERMERVTNDKLLTRLFLAARGVAVPATMALLMPLHPLAARAAQLGGAGTGVQVRVLKEGAPREPEARAAVESFLKTYQGSEVVVKPSGAQFHSGKGVGFFDRHDVDGMTAHALALAADPQMGADGAVLIEQRLSPPPVYLRSKGDVSGQGEISGFIGDRAPLRVLSKSELAGAAAKERKDWNVRVLAARAPWGGGAAAGLFARAGAWGVPTNAETKDPDDAAVIIRVEDLVAALREQQGLLKTEAEARRFVEDLEKIGRDAIDALADAERLRPLGAGEPRQAQTDFIGLDVMATQGEDGRLAPAIIEVNDHDSGGQWQLDELHPERAGEHSRQWVATMLERARLDALRGKRIVVVGAGYPGKRFIFERAKELGVEVVLIGGKRDRWARGLVSRFIDVDTTQRDRARERARAALRKGRVDGVTTFWEDDVPLAARLAQDLGLPYHSPRAADAARSKFSTRQVMEAAGLPVPRYRIVRNRAELEAAFAHVGFPAVLKPAFGAEAMGVRRVDDPDAARRAYEEISRTLTPELDGIFSYGSEMVLEQYLEGREWDEDVVMQGGRAALVLPPTDNWPTREPGFVPTGASLPSRVLSSREQAEAGELAVKTAQALGLSDGVIHVEGKTTPEGPRIVEANARMGGVYVRDWVKTVWGVDLVDQQLLVAAGIPAAPVRAPAPLAHLEGEFVIPDRPGLLETQDLSPEGWAHPGLQRFRPMMRRGQRVGGGRTAMIEARGASAEEARRNLDGLRAQLVLSVGAERDRWPWLRRLVLETGRWLSALR